MNYKEWLVSRTHKVHNVCGGDRVFKDTRLQVIFISAMAQEEDAAEIYEGYPQLLIGDVENAKIYWQTKYVKVNGSIVPRVQN